jgi:hypothetical protein
MPRRRTNVSCLALLLGVLLAGCVPSSSNVAATTTGQRSATPLTTAEPPAETPAQTATVFVPLVGTPQATPAGWTSRAPLLTARTEVAAVGLDGLIYVAGGYAADGSTLAIVERYNPASDEWTTVARLPEGRNHMGLAALGGRLYAVGGYSGPISASTATADVWTYDPVANSWASVAPLPTPRAAHALAADGEHLYVVGGVGPEARTTLAYNPAADRWDALAPIPTEREHLAAAVLDGRIYAIAGRTTSGNLDVAEVYLIAENRWQALPPLPTARSGLAAAILDGRLAVVGGEAIDGSGRTFAELELFDPATAQWAAEAPMPTPRHGLGVVVVDGVLYALGGGPVAGLTVSGANERFVPGRP